MISKRYLSNKVYADYEWTDETSSYDPEGRWQYGSESYIRTYKCRVPKRMLEKAEQSGDYDKLHEWIDTKTNDFNCMI